MNTTITSRQRFKKPFYLNAGQARMKGLKEAFSFTVLDDLRYDLLKWQEIAFCNDEGLYETAAERETLICFLEGLIKLAEAFYIVYARKHRQPLKQLSRPARRLLRRENRPQYLTGAEKAAPQNVIAAFTQTCSLKYARAELLDLLEAVVSYEGPRAVCKTNLVLLYRQLDYLVRLAYRRSWSSFVNADAMGTG